MFAFFIPSQVLLHSQVVNPSSYERSRPSKYVLLALSRYFIPNGNSAWTLSPSFNSITASIFTGPFWGLKWLNYFLTYWRIQSLQPVVPFMDFPLIQRLFLPSSNEFLCKQTSPNSAARCPTRRKIYHPLTGAVKNVPLKWFPWLYCTFRHICNNCVPSKSQIREAFLS